VAQLPGHAETVLERVGAVVATSANRPGGPDPRTLADIPEEIRAGAAAAIDGGKLAGVPSTVLDLTGHEPKVLREGAVSAREALERVLAVPA
jgi:L-threonylcarbamoyladenylate synthase